MVTEQVDVIVNPTNQYLGHGDNISKAIAIKAGEQFGQECDLYIK